MWLACLHRKLGSWFSQDHLCFAANAGSHQRNDPFLQRAWSFHPREDLFSSPLAQTHGTRQIQSGQGSKQLGMRPLELLLAGWSIEDSPTMPDKYSSLQQSLATPLKADKTLSTVSRFIFPFVGQGNKAQLPSTN